VGPRHICRSVPTAAGRALPACAYRIGGPGQAGSEHGAVPNGDLAVLRALGLTPRQAAGCVGWRAGVIGVVALTVGIPRGTVVGRQVWRLVADSLSFVYVGPVVGLLLLALIPIALGVLALLALWPARGSARLDTGQGPARRVTGQGYADTTFGEVERMRTSARRSGLAVLGAVALVAAACGGGGRVVAGGTTSSTTVLLGAATNAVAVTVPAPPRYVRGSDGKIHLEYDLVTTDVMSAPVSLTSLVVKDGDTELAHLDAEALEHVTFAFLSPVPTADIAPSSSVVSIVDVVLPTDRYADVPRQVTNELSYTIADNAPFRTIIRSLTTAGPSLDIDRYTPVVIEPPLRGDGWLALNACCNPSSHRSFVLPSGGTLHSIETFAIDWVKFVDGRAFDGDETDVTAYFGFGETVYAATDGVVVSVRNDMPEAPLDKPNDTVKAPDDYGGNGVVVKINNHQYALYGHFMTGSVIPAVGEQVKAGDPLGKLGNTGNSSAPHLHFGIQEAADAFASNSVPYVIRAYTLEGTGTFSSDGVLTVTPVNSPQRRTLPLENDVIDFG
jgi:hypothetical protein